MEVTKVVKMLYILSKWSSLFLRLLHIVLFYFKSHHIVAVYIYYPHFLMAQTLQKCDQFLLT